MQIFYIEELEGVADGRGWYYVPELLGRNELGGAIVTWGDRQGPFSSNDEAEALATEDERESWNQLAA